MRISIGELKKLIREEVERNMRWSAGFFMGGNISKGRKGVIPPPPGLGARAEDEEDEQYYGKEEQEEPVQAGVRADKRARRSSRASGGDRRGTPGNPV
jgi:hypothetical protein